MATGSVRSWATASGVTMALALISVPATRCSRSHRRSSAFIVVHRRSFSLTGAHRPSRGQRVQAPRVTDEPVLASLASSNRTTRSARSRHGGDLALDAIATFFNDELPAGFSPRKQCPEPVVCSIFTRLPCHGLPLRLPRRPNANTARVFYEVNDHR